LFSPLANQQRVSVGLGMPLLDWGRQKAQIGIADANEKVVAYTLEQERRSLETRLYHQVKTQELLRANTGYARRASAIADERFQLALEQYRAGELALSDIARALEEKELFRRTYVQALRRFWEGHYVLLQH
jgi:outer membrane protein TolC